MNCWHCDTKLIWGGDHDTEDEEGYSMVTNLTCPNCGSFHLVYLPKEEQENDKQKEIDFESST